MSADPVRADENVHSMEEFAEGMLRQIEELDALLHHARDDLQAKLRVLRAHRDPAFQAKVAEAERVMKRGKHVPDPGDLLEKRLTALRG